jgi:hypothetical protein
MSVPAPVGKPPTMAIVRLGHLSCAAADTTTTRTNVAPRSARRILFIVPLLQRIPVHDLHAEWPNRILKNQLLVRLLKKVQMQGGSRRAE